MLFFFVAASLTFVVAFALVRPLLRDLPEPAPAHRFNAAVYRDQLEELQMDADRGSLPEGDVQGARLEIERRLLGAVKTAAGPPTMRPAPISAAFMLAGLLTLGAGSIYIALGSPTMADQPLKLDRGSTLSRAVASGPTDIHAQKDRMVADLQSKLAAHPDDSDGWGLLARTLMRLDRAAEAVPAYERAIATAPTPNSQLDAEYAEARVVAAQGQVDQVALGLFDQLHAADAANPQARYYIALAKAQQGDTQGALIEWRALLADSPSDAPWLPTLRQRIAEASGDGTGAPGPSSRDVAAANSMSDADRQKMIQMMVEELAARLKQSPDDLDGWRRLARAYAVLGSNDKAADAERQVLRLAPDDVNAKAVLGVR